MNINVRKATLSDIPAIHSLVRELAIYEKADAPYLSMDICESESGYGLLEFQAIHFGINPIIKNKGYYQQKNNDWVLVPEIPPLEKLLADGFAGYIRERTKWLQER